MGPRLWRGLVLLVVVTSAATACDTTAAGFPETLVPPIEQAIALCPGRADEIAAVRSGFAGESTSRQRVILAYVVDRALVPGWDSYPPWPILPTRALTLSAEIAKSFPFGPGDRVVGFFKSSRSSANGEIFLGPGTLADVPRPTLDPPATYTPPHVGNNPLFPGATPSIEPSKQFCDDEIGRWVAREKARLADRDAAQRALIEAFRKQQVDAFTTERGRLENGARQADRSGDDLAGALSVIDGLAAANPDAQVKALLFTDLTDTAQTAVQPHLRRIDVIVALYRRADPADEKKHMDLWHQRMCGWGAASVSFVKWAATTSDLLLDILEQRTTVEGARCQ